MVGGSKRGERRGSGLLGGRCVSGLCGPVRLGTNRDVGERWGRVPMADHGISFGRRVLMNLYFLFHVDGYKVIRGF